MSESVETYKAARAALEARRAELLAELVEIEEILGGAARRLQMGPRGVRMGPTLTSRIVDAIASGNGTGATLSDVIAVVGADRRQYQGVSVLLRRLVMRGVLRRSGSSGAGLGRGQGYRYHLASQAAE